MDIRHCIFFPVDVYRVDGCPVVRRFKYHFVGVFDGVFRETSQPEGMVFSRRFQARDGAIGVFIKQSVYISLRENRLSGFTYQVFLEADNIGIRGRDIIEDRMFRGSDPVRQEALALQVNILTRLEWFW